jgi:hypothetical protein
VAIDALNGTPFFAVAVYRVTRDEPTSGALASVNTKNPQNRQSRAELPILPQTQHTTHAPNVARQVPPGAPYRHVWTTLHSTSGRFGE